MKFEKDSKAGASYLWSESKREGSPAAGTQVQTASRELAIDMMNTRDVMHSAPCNEVVRHYRCWLIVAVIWVWVWLWLYRSFSASPKVACFASAVWDFGCGGRFEAYQPPIARLGHAIFVGAMWACIAEGFDCRTPLVYLCHPPHHI